MNFPELYVLRHGETEWNAQNRMQGTLNSPLTDLGIEQARRQGQIFQGIDLKGFSILSSPQGRAFQTAALALAGRVDHIHTDKRLMEIGVGEWAGRIRSELAPPDQFEDTPDGALELYELAPGGEGFAALEQRCKALLSDLSGPTVMVTHGITSRVLRATVLGLGLAGMAQMPGGQGVVYHLKDGVQKRLS
ncbi:histidine phosphatase family protein [Ascidiaceihabitans sp.]|uniref:histidine phosphatase family protein n=1 Tax=Ascidiaceihabitans sp. TaxID=1872644 RepID=UPI003298EB69